MYKTLYSIQFDIEKYYKDFDTMKVIMQDIDQNIEIYTKNIIEIEIIIVINTISNIADLKIFYFNCFIFNSLRMFKMKQDCNKYGFFLYCYRSKPKTFAFDHCFYSLDPAAENFANQDVVFDALGRDILDNAFQGYNACIFAYGQTGKTIESSYYHQY